MTKVPSTRVVRAVSVVRTTLQNLAGRMIPPEVGLLELVSGFMATQTIYAATRLRLADLLADGPLLPLDIARQAGSDPDATHRLLRACTTYGVFTEGADGRFALTPLAAALRSGTPDSMRPVIMMLGDPRYQGPWGRLADTVETGTPGAEMHFGKPMWDYVDDDPQFAGVFHDAMSRLAALDWPAVEAVYDFSRFSTIVDIGGGHGELLARMLDAAPTAQGVLLERPALVAQAEEHLERAGVLARCRIEAGSFFEVAPADGDLYVLRRVVHDFDDDQAVALLSNLRRQMPTGARLLLMESVVPSGNARHIAKMLDLDMMIFVGGRERTARQFHDLLDCAGFTMVRIIRTISTIALVEATPGRTP